MHKLLFILFSFYLLTAESQDLRPCQNEKNSLYGYCNSSENTVIDHQFSSASKFIGDYAIVIKDQKYGLIDKKGEYYFPLEYHKIIRLDNGQIVLEKEDKFVGIFSETGDTIMPFYETKWGASIQYVNNRDGTQTQTSGFLVRHNGKMDYVIDSKLTYNFKYDFITEVTVYLKSNEKLTFCLVSLEGNMKMVDFQDQTIFNFPDFDHYHGGWPDWSNPIQVVRKEGEFIFYNLNTGSLLNSIVQIESSKEINWKIVDNKNKYGLLGPDGKLGIPFQYDELIKMQMSKDLFIAKKGDEWGIVSGTGEIQNPFYSLVNGPSISFNLDGHSYANATDAYLVHNEGKQAIYFMDGRHPLSFRFEIMGLLQEQYNYHLEKQLIFGGKPGKLKIYSLEEQLVSNLVFEEIYGVWRDSKFALVKYDGIIKYFNMQTNELHSQLKNDTESFQVIVNRLGKYGLAGSKGNLHLDCEYDYIYHGGGDYYQVTKDSLSGTFYTSGEKAFQEIEWNK